MILYLYNIKFFHLKKRHLKIVKNINSIAKHVILNESFALKNSSTLINSDFEQFVLDLINSKGRVVVTGIGKSAIIASNISATFNSTGTPSLYMHAGDAIHGDIGMICEDDMVLCISKSGDTAEIKALVPFIKRRGVKLAAIVSNMNSYLAKQSDYVLDGSIEKEVCPNNIVPTASTIVHLALGHALAICLLELRNFSLEDYAKLHPGGSIGNRLYLRVDDLILLNEKPVLLEDASVREVIVEISAKRLGAVAVLDQNDNLCGIITDGDLRRMLEKSTRWEQTCARDIMSKKPITMEIGNYAANALHVMQQHSITQIIIMDKNTVAGFVHLHDILKKGII